MKPTMYVTFMHPGWEQDEKSSWEWRTRIFVDCKKLQLRKHKELLQLIATGCSKYCKGYNRARGGLFFAYLWVGFY